ncbi:hypothetical protein [Shewanella sp. NIFS-20-20]|uniref:hypothetical protein n=1 Tax=Shewanella sp. NIFS-20-20 TaxID=2853806 RepID=UPI001C43E812|nr:hypothetical protein [Shewanella sp. NIFS-20-20]MBV7317130.1 hypothetical protein [Shewanella sp. NIFS-20-20]
MGMADLKKTASSANRQQTTAVSIDDFIDDATFYAMGTSQLTNPAPSPLRLVEPVNPLPSTQFRNATFSFSEQAITELAEMVQEEHQSKSKLLRQLIHAHYQLTAQQRATLEDKYKLR